MDALELGAHNANSIAKQIAAQITSQTILGRSLNPEALNAILDFFLNPIWCCLWCLQPFECLGEYADRKTVR